MNEPRIGLAPVSPIVGYILKKYGLTEGIVTQNALPLQIKKNEVDPPEKNLPNTQANTRELQGRLFS